MMNKTELSAVLDGLCVDKKTDIINDLGQDQRLGLLISSQPQNEKVIKELNNVLLTKEFFTILFADVRNDLIPIGSLTSERLEHLFNLFYDLEIYKVYDNSGYALALKHLKDFDGAKI